MSDDYTVREHSLKTFLALAKLMSAEEGSRPQAIYLQSEKVRYRNDTDRELSFRQESNFYYLTGCDLPNSALLMYFDHNPEPGTSAIQSTLFIPKEDPLETMWSPPPPDLEKAHTMYESENIAFTSTTVSVISELFSTKPDVLVHILPLEPTFPEQLPLLAEADKDTVTSKHLLTALAQARLIKTPHEISLIRKANAISSRAHEVIMRLLGKHAEDDIVGLSEQSQLVMPGDWRIEKEAEAEAAFVATCRREGALHQAYLPIVAGAERASTLHYCCNDRQLAWGPLPVPNGNANANGHFGHVHDLAAEAGVVGHGRRLAPQVLLLDAGCEWRNYASDITRTTPVGNGGKFTKEAREIYNLVLKMQNDAIASLKPDVHWDEIHYQCHVTLVREFIRLGIFVGEEQEVLDSQISAAFFPHGLGHSLGLDVHDVPSVSKPAVNPTIPASSAKHPDFYKYLRLRLPLKAGMVLTVEPGIYFSPHLLLPVRWSKHIDQNILCQYESVGGVRIEDVLVITETGAENLTVVGKDTEWIEAVCSGKA